MQPTIQQIIDELIAPVGVLAQTVDTLKFGSADAEVTGIMVAFMPTQFVLEHAIQVGANLVIAHEGLWYAHHDSGETEDTPVHTAKRRIIKESGLAVFRFHDYIHRYQPDGINEGLVRALGWESSIREHQGVATFIELQEMSLRELADYVKAKLGIPYVRVVGDMEMTCRKLALTTGYRGGGATGIPLLTADNVDVFLCGEGPEWETPEYMRDAVHQGRNKALIVLGHAESEGPGMELLADRLRERYPAVPVHYVQEDPIFTLI
jgi:putative NIF3 family GTP cyclohydrolase 1 type 2